MRKALDEAGYDDALGNGLYAIGGLARLARGRSIMPTGNRTSAQLAKNHHYTSNGLERV
jgi:hypothetical protein